MGSRRSQTEIAGARKWREFLVAESALIAESGLPLHVTESQKVFDEFLMHGFVRGDRSGFIVDQLTERQYAALKGLTNTYFEAHYPDATTRYTPMALNRK